MKTAGSGDKKQHFANKGNRRWQDRRRLPWPASYFRGEPVSLRGPLSDPERRVKLPRLQRDG